MKRWRQGFTLVELMVAGMIASIVLAAVYMTYTRSVRGYRVQNEILETYGRLRFGLDHLKADIRRAGVSATLNAGTDPFVRPPLPPVPLLAFSVSLNFPESVPVDANDNVQPSALLLFGDYFTPVVFPETPGTLPTPVAFPIREINGTVFEIDPSTVLMGQAEFDAAFLPAGNTNARLLHVEHRTEGAHYYFPIADADFANRTVTVGTPVPPQLLAGIYKSIYVNPVGFVRYRIAPDERPLGPADSSGQDAPIPGKTDLVREQVAWNDLLGDSIPGTRLVVVENAVDLQVYDFVFDGSPKGQPPALSVVPDVTGVVNPAGQGMLGQDATARPENLRFVTVKLSVRAADEDPDTPFRAREGVFAPLRRYDVDPDAEGSARVESLALRVQLYNATMRDM